MYCTIKGEFYDITRYKFGTNSYSEVNDEFRSFIFSKGDSVKPLYEDFKRYSILNLQSFISQYYNSKDHIELNDDELEELETINSYLLFTKTDFKHLYKFSKECYNRASNPKYKHKDCGEFKFDIPYEFKPLLLLNSADDEIGCYMYYYYLCNLCEISHRYGSIKYKYLIRKMQNFIKLYSTSDLSSNAGLAHDMEAKIVEYNNESYIDFYLWYSQPLNEHASRRELYEIIQYLETSSKPEDKEILPYVIDNYKRGTFYRGQFPNEKYEKCLESSKRPVYLMHARPINVNIACYSEYDMLFSYSSVMDFGSKIYQKFCQKFDNFIATYGQYATEDLDKVEYHSEYSASNESVAFILVHAKIRYVKVILQSRNNLYKLLMQYLNIDPKTALRSDDMTYLGCIKAYLREDDEFLPIINRVLALKTK